MTRTNWMWSFFWPGLGHLALGRPWHAAFFALWGALALFGVGFSGILGIPRGLMVAELALVVVVSAWHAYRCEQRWVKSG